MAQLKNSGRIASDHMPQRGPSATKSGPGRKHRAGKPGNRLTKARPQRAYVALMAAAAQKRIVNWDGPRSAIDGSAFVFVGRNLPIYGEAPWDLGLVVGWTPGRRMWLAGISAQRGY